MDRLHQQLKYFVTDKITNDPLWRDCSVILSGHETPGEGEHKIMDYIRYLKTRPDYDPHMRHCLYGLDADLIMLGLCTHDPHFCLLREEVSTAIIIGTCGRIRILEILTGQIKEFQGLAQYLTLA